MTQPIQMSTRPVQPRPLTQQEQDDVERVTTFEQLRGVVYKFKGERKKWWEESRRREACR